MVLVICTPWGFHNCFHFLNWLISSIYMSVKNESFFLNSNNLAKKCSTTLANHRYG